MKIFRLSKDFDHAGNPVFHIEKLSSDKLETPPSDVYLKDSRLRGHVKYKLTLPGHNCCLDDDELAAEIHVPYYVAESLYLQTAHSYHKSEDWAKE